MKPASKYLFPFVLPQRAINLTATCVMTAALAACGGSGGGTIEGGSGDSDDLDPSIIAFGDFTPTADDPDGDGLSADQELLLGLNPNDADSNGNGIFDGNEDDDEDGVSNLNEFNAGTDPTSAPTLSGNFDADGDGLFDFEEDEIGTDPTLALSLIHI